MVIAKYVLAWIPMVFLAIANGLLRELTYGKWSSELRAHQLSTLTGIALVAVYVGWITGVWKLDSPARAIQVGVLWLMLTVAFEFLFGHYVAGHSWQRLLRDYDLFAGRVWLIFLLFTAISPWLFERFHR